MEPLKQLTQDGTQRWLDTTHKMLELHRRFGTESGAAIENLLEHPPACQILATQ
jgi:hypothetical protein